MPASDLEKDSRVTSGMIFHPPLVLDSHGGDAAKNFPISLRIYSSTSDKSELYRLRYRAFRAAGWIAENEHGALSDDYDVLPSTFAVGAFHSGQCIGSLRLAMGGTEAQGAMPCEIPFASEVAGLVAAGSSRLVEFSRMAVEPALTNNSFRTTLYASLVRAGFILTAAADVDVVLVAVHRKFSPFYQAMCGFKVIAKSDGYGDISEPTHFLGRALGELDARRRQRNAFFTFSPEEIERARHTLGAARVQAAA
ncbi:MAG TPA: acyl-homoserine-lactone synthase [Hyphomicrobium sp.]|nr:acyl-homoserine-lactone synthase [Hyphomicrobium sp.]